MENEIFISPTKGENKCQIYFEWHNDNDALKYAYLSARLLNLKSFHLGSNTFYIEKKRIPSGGAYFKRTDARKIWSSLFDYGFSINDNNIGYLYIRGEFVR